jgi:hypothetical protein
MCDRADALLTLFEWFLSDKSNTLLFFDFLKSKQPKEFLYSRFIELNNIQFPGLSINKIIELDLVDVPKDDFKELLNQRMELLVAIEKANKLNFNFPLSKFYYNTSLIESVKTMGDPDFIAALKKNPIEGGGVPFSGFEFCSLKNGQAIINLEFRAALFNHVRKFTSSERENEVLTVVENAINSLNDLIELDIIRNDKQRWNNDLSDFLNAIVFSLNSDRPLSINPMLAKFKGFRKHFEDKRFRANTTGQPDDILNVKDPDPEQFEELPENILLPDDLKNNLDSEIEQTEIPKAEAIQTE